MAAEDLAAHEEQGLPYPPAEFDSLACYLTDFLKGRGWPSNISKIGDEFANAFPAFAECILTARCAVSADDDGSLAEFYYDPELTDYEP